MRADPKIYGLRPRLWLLVNGKIQINGSKMAVLSTTYDVITNKKTESYLLSKIILINFMKKIIENLRDVYPSPPVWEYVFACTH